LIKELAAKKHWIFDVDDCLYSMICGLHARIKARICDHANARPDILGAAAEWLGEQRLVTPPALGNFFPNIVKHTLRQALQADTWGEALRYFKEVYGDDYALIAPQPAFIAALKRAEALYGKDIGTYTNGPSWPLAGVMLHTQRVWQALGADLPFIEKRRRRTYDLINTVTEVLQNERLSGTATAAHFAKGTREHARSAMASLGVAPRDCVYFDDSIKALEAMAALGASTIWTWSSDTPPPPEDIALAKKIGAVRVQTPYDLVVWMVEELDLERRNVPHNDPARHFSP
jgi:FMN phosphatase YigB (HAD superfamily)